MLGQHWCFSCWKMAECYRTGALMYAEGYSPPGHFHVDLFRCPSCKIIFSNITTSECRDECENFADPTYIFKEIEKVTIS